MLSFASFGATRSPSTEKVRRATEIVRELNPKVQIDGEIQADVAIDAELREELFPFATLKDSANVLIFPNLDSGNIAYKLMLKLAGAAKDLPPDFAAEHDHYIHGTPRRTSSSES